MAEVDLTQLPDNPRVFLGHPDTAVRRLAVSACAALLDDPEVCSALTQLLDDPEPAVRAEATEVLGHAPTTRPETLLRLRDDPDGRVVEAVATALGEIGGQGASPWLETAARTHQDRMVREAAVASLGALGDPEAIPVLLDLASSGVPQIRRRAVVALTVFDDPRIEPALNRAAEDRNPMVREVAQIIVGRPATEWSAVEIRQRGEEAP